MTPTTVGWVLADGQDADGSTLSGAEFTVDHRSDGTDALNTSATAAAVQLHTMVKARGHRLRGIGVTWSDGAAAEAALLLESLTEAGFDNVVPVRFPHAAESLAQEVEPVGGLGHIAVCLIEPGLATVVLVGSCADGAAATPQHAADDGDDVVSWLAEVFDSGSWRPGALVLAGSGTDLDALAVRLEAELALPVFVRARAHLGLARGAARVLRPGAEFPGVRLDDGSAGEDVGPTRRRSLSYTGALTMLVAGVVAFVVSLSAAVSLQLTPASHQRPPERAANVPTTTASGARASAPPVTAPPAKAPARQAEIPDAPATFGSVWQGAHLAGEVAVPPGPPAMTPQPNGHRSLLSRVLDRILGLRGH